MYGKNVRRVKHVIDYKVLWEIGGYLKLDKLIPPMALILVFSDEGDIDGPTKLLWLCYFEQRVLGTVSLYYICVLWCH